MCTTITSWLPSVPHWAPRLLSVGTSYRKPSWPYLLYSIFTYCLLSIGEMNACQSLLCCVHSWILCQPEDPSPIFKKAMFVAPEQGAVRICTIQANLDVGGMEVFLTLVPGEQKSLLLSGLPWKCLLSSSLQARCGRICVCFLIIYLKCQFSF